MRRRNFYRMPNGKDEARLQETINVAHENDIEESRPEPAEDQQKAITESKKARIGCAPCPHCGRPDARYFHILWCKDNPERGKR